MHRFLAFCLLSMGVLLSSCGNQQTGAVDVAIISNENEINTASVPYDEALRPVYAALSSGLVGLDEDGEIVPELADRWIITDDGKSYIFRLREGTWPDGSELTAASARRSIRKNLRALRSSALGRDLAAISEVRAMAGRVIEFRLSSPTPNLLQMLAQPEMALSHGSDPTGPMMLMQSDGDMRLIFRAPEQRGLPPMEDWNEGLRPIALHLLPADAAIRRFYDGDADIVLGGTLGDLPLVDTGPLSRGTVRLEPALGLFGLQVQRADGVLASPEGREAVAMAIDRSALMQDFNIGGWLASTRVIANGLEGDLGTIAQRWTDATMEERQQEARRRIDAWATDMPSNAPEGALAELSIYLPSAPGYAKLFDKLAGQLAEVGIVLSREDDAAKADLVLVDRAARYAGVRWFLNQFSCKLKRGLCSPEADQRLADSLAEPDPAFRAGLLAEAEAELTAANIFIPFGEPVRWSLIRGGLTGYAANSWGFHPLPPLATRPN
ncbi:ABC transporter substrate-binding protein [Altericroceibacterium endophyticum]|uniref:ABC transporter substrate-binding protein n=1 Tax=Altericroceibacterium endophyticum TaxID=1808508 RepID=A0A6I4T6D6_9SPHN|nr:ABC transporter substrate-binding protein [Altericroceibacterium endophyticum]MXO65470.1 ABC transporter substrate-binding protein [Altericroceibacterium endophyticum]